MAAISTQQAALAHRQPLRLRAISTDASINATQQAAEATKTAEATLFAMQVADINFQRAFNQTQVALDLDRKEATNTILAFAPYLFGSIILTALIWLIVRFGQVEVNRRKLIEGSILDNHAVHQPSSWG